MGECFISRRGGGEAYKLPILDTNYPQDISVMATPNGIASFSIAIAEHGKPTDYTYQWYVNGEAVSGAINANYSMNATANNIGTYTVYCDITNKAGTISSRAATLRVKNAVPNSTTYSYSGTSELKKDSNYDWTLYLKSSGVLALGDSYNVDIFVQGGGGGGASYAGDNGEGGGGGGYQNTQYAQTISGSNDITIGAGGAIATTGGTSIAFGFRAAGGNPGNGMTGGTGTGNGGAGGWYWDGGNQGNPGGNGGNGKQAFGVGDTYYGAGGGGAASKFGSPDGKGGTTGGGNAGSAATANTGSGGGGNAAGGSGIVIIRNAR